MKKQSFEHMYNAMFHGKYSFSDFLNCDIDSEYTTINLRDRVIYSSSKKLKDFHKFLNLFIFDFLHISIDSVFSYRKGYNVVDAVQMHKNGKYFFQSDIVDFFPSIHENLVKSTLKHSLESTPILDLDKYLDLIIKLTMINNNLPIGFSTSPLISNAVLLDFDEEILSYCRKKNIQYSRYSDDIIFSAENIEEIIEVPIVVEKCLISHYNNTFKINKSKSKIKHIGGKVKILGMVIMPNGSLTIDSKLKNIIETLLHLYRTDKQKLKEISENDLENGIKKITNYLNYINAVDANYLLKLKKKYGPAIIDYFIHKKRN
ncbi:reverse transcriptase domain-containing protein [Janthinobacterium sp. B9-8]|uniref:reverse transcriptase domain-containing protein n=1 Tax=Janthinobacterium sp. B9-8 TaxID=1236179 RepID=UPI00061D2B3E|nr:reverse transcriptase domain-containing protein [Janthinobacterium sp. B9-8]AMC33140.1 hypothetical protein VN23_00135 [Janthinobacterium sp. B9-8]